MPGNLILAILLCSSPLSATALGTRFDGLDPTSLREHLAFYELYKDTPEGKLALQHAWKLISGKDCPLQLAFPENINEFIALINPLSNTSQDGFSLSPDTLAHINSLSAHFPNRRLKGHTATSLQEVMQLPSEEIDLARALLISQYANQMKKIQTFEAALDLMALQVLAKLPERPSAYDKIRALNQFIFFEMGFRFPPHSAYNGKIDLFTFLPHVLESRRGVCLGVSTLYLSLAQRIDLSLEIITPPGHIYIRYKEQDREKNIETTCRGVHIPTEEYLSINTKKLERRKLKEVIGMAHFNHASSYLSQEDFKQASECYEKALAFMPDDLTLKILYGCSLLLSDRHTEALQILEKVKNQQDVTQVSQNTLLIDILNKHVDKESLAPYFYYVDQTRESIVRKKNALEAACKRSPRFRMGLFSLAMCWLQLERESEAIRVLQQYHAIDPSDITVEFYLAELYFSRFDAPSAWKHCLNAQKLAASADYTPRILQRFTTALSMRSPRPKEGEK